MLMIDNDLVKRLLTMAECIRVQEEAFKQIPTGGAIHRPRIDMYFPCERDDGYYRWGSMEGASDGMFAIRMKSDIVTWPRDANGNWTEDKYCIKPGIYCGLVLLFSTRNGEPLAIINDGHIQHMRVGGGAGLGVKYLSRKDSHVVGMLGSGGMAQTFLEAYCAVRDIQKVKVFSLTPANRERYAETMKKRLGIDVVPVASAREAVRGVDILSCCTDSMSPVFDADWLEPGMHVANLNPAEVSEPAYRHFDVVIRQGTAGGRPAQDSDRQRMEVGLSPMAYIAGSEDEMKRLPKSRPELRGFGGEYPHFADLALGKVPGRTNHDQITFYHNIGNQGLQFSSVGGFVYRKATTQGLGRELPTEWFVQDIRD
ncbi:MAG: ornithine cyclodeaminase family protein [Betaproteobacteria bacterium]|nr:ornithine cyclodeaminase family protein [Betaproteobacteria bacterium]